MSLKTSKQTSKQWKIPLLGHKDADWWRKTVCLLSSSHYHVHSVKWSLKCCQEEYRNDSSGMKKFLTAQDTFFFLFEAESHDLMILLPQSRLLGLHACHGAQLITGHSLKNKSEQSSWWWLHMITSHTSCPCKNHPQGKEDSSVGKVLAVST